MGIAPEQAGNCTLWQWLAMVKSWNVAQGAEEGPSAPSPDEHKERLSRLVH